MRHFLLGTASALLLLSTTIAPQLAAQETGRVLARGAESYGPVTPFLTRPLAEADSVPAWKPGDPIKEVPRLDFSDPGKVRLPSGQGDRDPLLERRGPSRAPTINVDLNFDGQGFTGATPPDTVGDVGPDHYVQAVNASRIAIYDKAGTLLPGYPINLDSLAPGGDACTSGSGDPIVLYDWLADRWFLQEFTGGGRLCLYISTGPDPTGTYNFYGFDPPSFPDYPHYGVWPDAYYAGTNEAGGGGNQTTYAFDRQNMLLGAPATMQRLTVIPPVSGYGFQTVTPADHDGSTAPPPGSPGIFMRHFDDEAHTGSPAPATDLLEMWEMDVDFATPANTTVTALPSITITDFNSWMVNYTTFFSVSQPGSGTLLDPIREAILQRLVYRNFGSHETLLGVFATNRDPAITGSNNDAGARWFELRRSGGGWTLHDEGTFGGDINSDTANFFMGSVAMDGAGNIALGYNKTDTGASPVNPSLGITGRLAADAPGTLGPENDVVLGGGPSSSGRWGDYANMSIDPADDCTFWFTGEYIPVSGSWGTRITSFVFEECLFGYTLAPTPSTLEVCAPSDPDPTFDVAVSSNGGWSFNVALAGSGEPAGTNLTFSANNQLPDFTSTVTVNDTDAAATGSYTLQIDGTGGDAPPTLRSTSVALEIAAAAPGAPVLGPPNGNSGVSLVPTLEWSAASDATSYTVEVATDPGFGTVVYSAAGLTGTSHTVATALDPSTTYSWRVRADNLCGMQNSATGSFTTVQLECQTFFTTDAPHPIPQGGGTSGQTLSTINVPAASGGTVASVVAEQIEGSHTYMGDLDFFLDSPAATAVQLFEQDCGTQEDFSFSFDDNATGTPPCPPTDGGTYAPVTPLAALAGEDSTGVWTLRIEDRFNGDTGQLDTWGLTICTEVDADIFADGFESGDTTSWSSSSSP